MSAMQHCCKQPQQLPARKVCDAETSSNKPAVIPNGCRHNEWLPPLTRRPFLISFVCRSLSSLSPFLPKPAKLKKSPPAAAQDKCQILLSSAEPYSDLSLSALFQLMQHRVQTAECRRRSACWGRQAAIMHWEGC